MVGAVSATATFAVGILRLIGTYRSSFRYARLLQATKIKPTRDAAVGPEELTIQTSPMLREGIGISANTAAELLSIVGDRPITRVS